MIEELIKKYEQLTNDNKAYSKYNEAIDLPNGYEDGKVEAYEEILQDLKELKDKISSYYDDQFMDDDDFARSYLDKIKGKE